MEKRPATIAYVRCSAKEGRNAAFPIHVLLGLHHWPGRVLDQRGLGGPIRYRRPANEREQQGIESNERALEYKYQTLAGLVEDEMRCGTSLEACREIIGGFWDMPKGDREAAEAMVNAAEKTARKA